MRSRVISIDKSVEPGTPRFNFTLAHELGHFLMHRHLLDYISIWKDFSIIEDGDRELYLNQLTSDNPKTWIEWQANKFAASLLLPRATLPDKVISIQNNLGITRNLGKIYLGSRGRFDTDYIDIMKELMSAYQVSKAALRIRLLELNILVEDSTYKITAKSGPRHVSISIANAFESLFQEFSSKQKER